MPSFKVPCPSCETQVLIKNPELVGTKVECPKCKYRFKVEEPAAEAAPEEKGKGKGKGKGKDKAAADPAAKAKKKDKSKAPVIAAVVAGVLVLGGVGYFVIGGSKKPAGTTGTGTGVRPVTQPVTNTGNEGTGDGEGNQEKKDEKKETPKVPTKSPLPRSDKNASNLLPPGAIAVYRFNTELTRHSPFFANLFDANADLFKTSMGFDADNVEMYYHCVVGAERNPFGVMRLREPVSAKELTAKMDLEPNPKTIKTRVLHTIKTNPIVSAVGQTFAARSLLSDVYETVPGRQPPSPPKPTGLCFYDTQTILLGDLATVEQFLSSLQDSGYPEFKNQFAAVTSTLPVEEKKDEQPKQEEKKDEKDTKPATPPVIPKGDYTTNPNYRTLSAELKRLLLAMEEDIANPPMIVFAEVLAPGEYDPKQLKKQHKPIGDVLDPVLAKSRALGVNLTTFNAKQILATIRVITDSDSSARTLANETITPGLTAAQLPLSLFLGTFVDLRNGAPPAASPFAGGPGSEGSIGSSSGGPGRPGPVGSAASNPIGSSPPRPGAVGSSGPGPGGAVPLPGGSSDSEGAPPRPQFGGGGKPGIGGPPGMGSGFNPYNPGGVAGQPIPGGGANPSFVELKTVDNTLTLTIDVTWSEEVYRRVIGPRLTTLANQTKGKMAVYAANYGLQPLADAVKGYTAKYKAFPRGTSDRPMHVSVGLPYPPSQRVSLFSELQPFMERSKSLLGPDRSMGWAEEKTTTETTVDPMTGEKKTNTTVKASNIPSAELWIPELLVPYYPPTAWRAISPIAPDKVFGGTNFVAVAGIGTEAARLDPSDPNAAKKVGISGYNWGSKLDEVTDGLDKTIFLIQVPPGLQRPWTAGGGATMVGLNENDPMADFAYARPDGEVGAYAIMGDGTVRWIPAKIDPKIFLAMATRAGGESLPDLDKIAPKVEVKKFADELKTVGETAPAPKERQ